MMMIVSILVVFPNIRVNLPNAFPKFSMPSSHPASRYTFPERCRSGVSRTIHTIRHPREDTAMMSKAPYDEKNIPPQINHPVMLHTAPLQVCPEGHQSCSLLVDPACQYLAQPASAGFADFAVLYKKVCFFLTIFN